MCQFVMTKVLGMVSSILIGEDLSYHYYVNIYVLRMNDVGETLHSDAIQRLFKIFVPSVSSSVLSHHRLNAHTCIVCFPKNSTSVTDARVSKTLFFSS